MMWMKEIETAKSIDDLITLKSITGKDFPDYDELDAMMTAALRKCYDRQTHFLKKISVEEQRAQKNYRFLRGIQIAFMIYDHFRSTGSYDKIKGLSGLFSIRLENDDIQDFGLRWSYVRVIHRRTKLWKVCICQNCRILHKSKRLWHCTIKKFFEEEENVIITDSGMCVKLHIEQAQRS